MFRSRVAVILFSFVFFVLLGCERHKNPWAPPSFLPRIWWGECIDWVFLGDDEATVIRKLGQPTFAGPSAIGNIDCGCVYRTGKHAGLSLGISYKQGVKEFFAQRPYSGTSKEGIGIRSRRSSVIRAIGQPDTSYYDYYGENDYYYFYNEDPRFMRVIVDIRYDREGIVEYISMWVP